MTETWNEITDVLSLFATSFAASLVVGAVSPLIGIFFVLRRLVFLGVAVPQFAAAGAAFSLFILPWWHETFFHESASGLDHEGHFAFHLVWALVFTFAALAVLALSGRRPESSEESRIATLYALAAAATILFLNAGAVGPGHVEVLLKGEILSLGARELRIIAVIFGAVLMVLAVFRRPFMLVSYDREAALSLGYRPRLWDLVFFGLVGTAISVGVLTVGPLVIFGLMVLPPLAARRLARNMTSLYLIASSLGIISTSVGFFLAYRLDWPLGPTDVALAFAIYLVIRLVKK